MDDLIYYTADVLLSHLVIHTLNVQVWRGLWNMLDHLILPDDKQTSYYVSLGAGYTSVILLFIFEFLIHVAARKLHQIHWLLELVLENVVKLTAVTAGLFLWRGGWGLMKDYVIVPPKDLQDCWMYHGVGMGLLLFLSAASTLSPVGCAVDGEHGHGKGVCWPIDYCTYLYQSWQQTRQHMPLSVQV